MTELQEQILSLFEDPNTPPKSLPQLRKELGRRSIPLEALEELVEDGRLCCRREEYFHPLLAGLAAGTYWDSGKNFGFVTPDGAVSREEDIFLPPHCSGQAWHGDRVLVELDWRRPGEERQTGKVIKLLRRKNETVVGKVIRVGVEYWIEPQGGKLPTLKAAGLPNGVRKGDLVQAKVLSYGGRRGAPMAQILRPLGKAGSRQAAVEAILLQQDIQREFPEEALYEAAHAPRQVYPSTRKNRLDLRHETIITIDGPYAKDLDDAVSLVRTETGWRLGVHIADVSHYVKEGSPLDQEALHRGTSVYFADQVIPMLPEELSNGICSLNPRVERLTLSCMMEMDSEGRVTDYQIAQSVIKTRHRMSYPDCNRLLAGEGGELEEVYSDVLPMLRDMAELSRKLRRLRRLRGALELDGQENVILCDEGGDPVGVGVHQTGESEGIIESFMLAANETVARHLTEARLPGVFRIHEKPSGDKLTRLRGLLAPFGYQLTSEDAFGMQKLLKAAEGKPESIAVSMVLLRSLMKAKYAPVNQGHFGLGAEYYCHFTSPIRRYPDLMVHRILTAECSGRCSAQRWEKLRRATAAAAERSSQREMAAETAERDIEKCYLAEYMQKHIGEEFEGIVTGVTRSGLFVTLSNGVEGRVGLETLPGLWDYDEEAMTLTSGKVTFTFAQSVAVKCVAADPGEGRVDLQLVGMELPKEPDQRFRRAMDDPPDRREKNRSATGKRRNGKKSNQRAMHVPRKGKKRH